MFTLIISTVITMSANNWISMWMGLELNMMSFIPIILKNPNKSSSEAAMIYFLIQSISSIVLLMMITMSMMKTMIPEKVINMITTMMILLKLGSAPFHKWMPEMMSKMEWKKCIMMMTWQKLAPLMMMSNLNNNMLMIKLSIIWSVGVGSIGGINQSSLRKMMAYSSINHLGWMLTLNKSINLWIIYWIIYSMIITMVCMMFNKYNYLFLNQINSLNMNNAEKTSLFISMLSMGGLPPFIGFLPKWITIQSMMNSKEFIMILYMIMFSLVTLMFYIRTMTNIYLSFNSTMKWMTINQSKSLSMMILMINFSLPLIMILDIL
uniref:NADH-ubiquinone oxidoreductase chain 2 n=2 Tax=Chinavia TaxID=1497371 RepID=A0A343YV96_9HEMI|nr:NADH dehydrogenase subunit 2 [Chinavia impicticornis]AWN56179.1 NADH dehydrogenase subunit 2 [Chinavia ubica]